MTREIAWCTAATVGSAARPQTVTLCADWLYQQTGDLRPEAPTGWSPIAYDLVDDGLGQSARFVEPESFRMTRGCFKFEICGSGRHLNRAVWLQVDGEPVVVLPNHGRWDLDSLNDRGMSVLG